MNNAKPPHFSDGFDIEVFNFKSLKDAFKNASTTIEKEHVTPYIKKNKKLNIGRFNQVESFDTKFSIDEPKDLKNVKKIFDFFLNDENLKSLSFYIQCQIK